MTKKELVRKIKCLKKKFPNDGGWQTIEADELLLRYINDEQVLQAYNSLCSPSYSYEVKDA